MTTVPRYQWQPTTPEIAAAAGISPDRVLRMDQNTSPFPTDWAVPIAADIAASLNEYPVATYLTIREAAGNLAGLDPTQVVPGAGVDELIAICARAFLSPGTTAVQVTPTYALYRIATAQVGARLVDVPAKGPGFDFPTEAVLDAAADAELTWLCVPNNPTGNPISESAVAAVSRAASGLVVIDAAYGEFTTTDWSAFGAEFDNIIVLRTLSKAFGLAGARVGYATARPELIDALDAVRPPGSISKVSVPLAVAALEAPKRMRSNVAAIVSAREGLEARLADLGWSPLPTETNFVLCRVGPEAHNISDELMSRGIVVRTFAYDALRDHLRFTVRTPQQHDRLIEALRSILK